MPTGETDLSRMLQSLSPSLGSDDYVFVTVEQPSPAQLSAARGVFVEDEGTTLIMSLAHARHFNFAPLATSVDLDKRFDTSATPEVFACITLNVHSSLSAVGLTAAFANALAAHHISANVVAGYYHDHIFVAKADADSAMTVLKALSASSA